MLLPVAIVVFVPLSLIETIDIHVELGSLDLGSGLAAAGALAAVLTLVGAALVGEVFYSGAIAVALTHDGEGAPPSLRRIARQLAYRRLIAVDLLFSAVVLAGLALLVFPGVVLYVWFGLAGPVVEIERPGVRRAFARSRQLVRGRFWFVLAVLGPIELAGEGIAAFIGDVVHGALGDSFGAVWLAETLANVTFTPFLAVAAVLLTDGLIAEKDGRAPPLHSSPAQP